MIRSILGGGSYALALFALGFVLGTLRVLMIVPLVGELAATLIEVPVMLTAAWFICRRIVRCWAVASGLVQRLVMAVTFLVLLLAGEMVLGLTLMGRSWTDLLTGLTTPAGLIGLAAQGVSAAFVLMVGRFRT